MYAEICHSGFTGNGQVEYRARQCLPRAGFINMGARFPPTFTPGLLGLAVRQGCMLTTHRVWAGLDPVCLSLQHLWPSWPTNKCPLLVYLSGHPTPSSCFPAGTACCLRRVAGRSRGLVYSRQLQSAWGPPSLPAPDTYTGRQGKQQAAKWRVSGESGRRRQQADGPGHVRC